MTDLVPLDQASEPTRAATLAAAWLRTRRSDNTRQAYARDLTSWLGWCQAHGLDPLDVWPGHVQLWLSDLAAQGESGSTRSRRLSAVSSWYRWLLRHGETPRNPAVLEREERPPRAPRRAPALSDDQVARLLRAADDDSRRSAALVWLLLTTGIRAGELCAANVADVGLDRGHPVLHITAKGGKRRTVPIVPPTYARLDAYLSARQDITRGELVPLDQAGAGHHHQPLFTLDCGQRMTRWQIRRDLRRLARAAGLPDALVATITPHSTRATYVTAALDHQVPLRDVQYAVGHASPVTTELYDRSHLTPDRNPAYRLLGHWSTAVETSSNTA